MTDTREPTECRVLLLRVDVIVPGMVLVLPQLQEATLARKPEDETTEIFRDQNLQQKYYKAL